LINTFIFTFMSLMNTITRKLYKMMKLLTFLSGFVNCNLEYREYNDGQRIIDLKIIIMRSVELSIHRNSTFCIKMSTSSFHVVTVFTLLNAFVFESFVYALQAFIN